MSAAQYLRNKFQCLARLKKINALILRGEWTCGRQKIRIAPSGTTTATASITRTKPTRQNIAVKTKASSRPVWVVPSVPEAGYILEAEDSRLEYSVP